MDGAHKNKYTGSIMHYQNGGHFDFLINYVILLDV